MDSSSTGVNFDIGNSYLAGLEPAVGIEYVASRLVHPQARDVSITQSEAERGKVTGTPAGCACGEDMIGHLQSLFDCARSRSQATYGPMDLAFRVQTALQRAILGHRKGKTARFDAKHQAIVV